MGGYNGRVRIGGLSGLVSLPVTVVAVILLETQGDGDFRVGAFPYLATLAGFLYAVCAYSLRNFNVSNSASRIANLSIVITMIGLLGLVGLFGSIAVGAVFDIQEGDLPGFVSWMPIAAGAAAVIGTPIGMVMLGILSIIRDVLPPGCRFVPIMQAVSIPVGMILVGILEGTAETLVGDLWFAAYALGWAWIGLGLVRWSIWTSRSVSFGI